MRFAASLGFGLVLACFGAAPSPHPSSSLEGLLAHMRSASGMPYRYSLVSRATEVIEGRTFVVTTRSEGLHYQARRCTGEVCNGFYFDGERGFETNLNDTALPLASTVDGLQLTLRAITTYAFLAPEFRSEGGRLSEHGTIVQDGKRLRRIVVAPLRGAVLDALVDPDSGLVVGALSDDRGLAFAFRDQRAIDGKVTLPFEIDLNGERIEQFDERTIADDRFVPPAGIVPTFTHGQATLKLLSVARAGSAPVVRCTIGGASVPCLLDTGNSGLSMSLELSEQLGLEPSGGAFAVSGVGRYATGVVKAQPLALGDVVFPAAEYVVLHDTHALGYDLVLGADVFAHARVTIDYAKRQVTFAPPDGPGLTNPIALTFANFVPVVPVRLNSLDAQLAVDTGDESVVNLRSDFYAQHPDLFAPKTEVPVAGVGGASHELVGEIASVGIGDYRVARPTIGATTNLRGTGDGHLGSGFLAHFTCVFDYQSEKLALVPHPGDASVTTADALTKRASQ